MSVHIRMATLLAALVVGVAGCGEEEVEAPLRAQATPTPAATEPAVSDEDAGPPLRMTAAIERRLDAGEIGVVDLANTAAIEPRSLLANREQELSGMEWSGWGKRRAVGRGTAATLDCEPNCGLGQTQPIDVRLVLSAPRTCRARRFYSRAEMTYLDPESGEQLEPAVYLRTPC